jgi:hypothetical protein
MDGYKCGGDRVANEGFVLAGTTFRYYSDIAERHFKLEWLGDFSESDGNELPYLIAKYRTLADHMHKGSAEQCGEQ